MQHKIFTNNPKVLFQVLLPCLLQNGHLSAIIISSTGDHYADCQHQRKFQWAVLIIRIEWSVINLTWETEYFLTKLNLKIRFKLIVNLQTWHDMISVFKTQLRVFNLCLVPNYQLNTLLVYKAGAEWTFLCYKLNISPPVHL